MGSCCRLLLFQTLIFSCPKTQPKSNSFRLLRNHNTPSNSTRHHHHHHHHHRGGFVINNNSSLSSSSSSSSNESESESESEQQQPPQEAVLKLISEVSKTEGRVGQTTNMVIGGTVTDNNNNNDSSTNEWLALDQKVNTYPTLRGFTAIGTGGDDFVQAMISAVESVLQHPIPLAHVKHKISSAGKYVSVNIGPVQVLSSHQVQAVYNAMRRDDRMKYFL